MRYFYSLEYKTPKYEVGVSTTEDTLQVSQIAIVAEDGRELLLFNWDVIREDQCIDPLRPESPCLESNLFGKYTTKERIIVDIIDFCDFRKYGDPEFWCFYSSYFSKIFIEFLGKKALYSMGNPWYCDLWYFDLTDYEDYLDVESPTYPFKTKRSGLDLPDTILTARWIRDCFEYIKSKYMGVRKKEGHERVVKWDITKDICDGFPEMARMQACKRKQASHYANIPYSEEDSLANAQDFFFFYQHITNNVDAASSFQYSVNPKNPNTRIYQAFCEAHMVHITYSPTEEIPWTYESFWTDIKSSGETLKEAVWNNQGIYERDKNC